MPSHAYIIGSSGTVWFEVLNREVIGRRIFLCRSFLLGVGYLRGLVFGWLIRHFSASGPFQEE